MPYPYGGGHVIEDLVALREELLLAPYRAAAGRAPEGAPPVGIPRRPNIPWAVCRVGPW
jgi:hypothetical protein